MDYFTYTIGIICNFSPKGKTKQTLKDNVEIYEALLDIEQLDAHGKDKLRLLFQIFNIILEQLTAEENVTFTSLFSRLSYSATKYKFDPELKFFAHQFRRICERQLAEDHSIQHILELGFFVCKRIAKVAWNEVEEEVQLSIEAKNYFHQKKEAVIGFKKIVEGLILTIDVEQKKIEFVDDLDGDILKTARYDVSDRNEIFTENINAISKIYDLPLHVNLIDVEILETGEMLPAAFVINPNFLMDVTSVAHSYKESGGDNWLHLMQKLMKKESSSSILVGNVANYILDQLIYNPDIDYSEIMKEVFRRDPIAWSLFDDIDVQKILEKIKHHYHNLHRVINEDFKKKDIQREDIYLEPSFYCRDFGVQGRLDLFHVKSDSDTANIIELKSGKPFRANSYGINQNHYTQTLLYDLIIQSSYYNKLKPCNYILYSVLEGDNLKYAPSLKQQMYETLKTRNDLVAIEHALANKPHLIRKLINFISIGNYSDLKGFVATDVHSFEGIISSLHEREKRYYEHYIAFIGREQILAKTGEHGVNKSNGLSALWMENMDEKLERFSIFNYLQISKNNSNLEKPTIVFSRTEYTCKLANFRIGDIGVLYPHSFNSRGILHHQIFKCSIVSIDDQEIVVQLRSPQHNQDIFRATDFWNIEEDVLDSAYRHMYQSMFDFIASDELKRSTILGHSAPGFHTQAVDLPMEDELSSEQRSILMKIYDCKDYFLLWGPPGTGKTSVMIKNLAQTMYKYSDSNIMLLAYTNKAVDEICHALHSASLQDEYIRIGSRASVHGDFLENMLEEKISKCKTRSDIVSLLKSKRIYVSTISSLIGKQEIFKLVNFDMAVVDEASQVLEPMLVGLLTRFKRFVLIGDHKQLPAVVRQRNSQTIIDDELLKQEGFIDLKMSLFERLLNQCKSKNWNHAWAILSHQGRMHKDIMGFVDQYFYEGKLKILTSIARLTSKRNLVAKTEEEDQWIHSRMIYIDSPTDLRYNWKTNRPEAEMVKQVIERLHNIYLQNNLNITSESIGVITPYRAQIALIKATLGEDLPITIDTVERYQGGARDIIILSLCTNKLSQLESLVNLSWEGIDRKLNVAITRAKEQVIIIGNSDILSTNPTYHALIHACKKISLS